jgi:hypothetical protein
MSSSSWIVGNVAPGLELRVKGKWERAARPLKAFDQSEYALSECGRALPEQMGEIEVQAIQRPQRRS